VVDLGGGSVALLTGGLCSLVLVADIVVLRCLVWPITALYSHPSSSLRTAAGVGRRRRGGRRSTGLHRNGPSPTPGTGSVARRRWCTLGDIAGGWLVFLPALQIAGLALFADYAVDFTIAFALGIAFQYFAIVPMQKLGVRDGLVASLKADTASLTAFEVGMFGWMALVQLVLFTQPHLAPDHAAYWFMMQIGMVLGFVTADPVDWWLIRRGIKEAM
jgi:hypothetical protein